MKTMRCNHNLAISLLLIALPGILAVGPVPAAEHARDSSRAQDRQASYQVSRADGVVLAQGTLAARDSVTLVGTGDSRGLRTLAPQAADQPTRVLIRLRGEPLAPFALRRQRELGGVSGTLTPTQRDQLQRGVDAQAAALRREQQALLDDLHARHLIDAVQRRFVHLTNSVSVVASDRRLGALRADPRVLSVHPDNRVTTTLATSVPLINAPALWAMQDPLGVTVTGAGITVAILDTGVDYRHPDLGGCLGTTCKVAGGYDLVDDDADPMDDHGHGTHVAGIVAADGVVRGVAPGASLLAYKVLDANGQGYESDVIAGIERAMDPDLDPLTPDQADVINMSLGGPGEPDAPLSEASDNAVAAGTVVVVAAGNSGPGYESIGSPGNSSRAITVAASYNFDEITWFSSRGPIAGTMIVKPDLSAPGFFINSTMPDASYGALSGTSMASPHVAGGVALLKQRDPALTPDAIRTLLAAGARDLDREVFSQGAGRIDLLASTQASLLADPPLLSFGAVDATQPVWTSERTFVLRNVGASPQAVALGVGASLPAGASMAFAPAASFVLAAGESRELHATLTVDNAVTAFPDSDSLHFEARIGSDAGAPLRIPIVFEKSHRLELTVEGSTGWGHFVVLRRDGDYLEKVSGGSDADRTHAFRLRPGAYHAIAMLWAGDAFAWVQRENIVVDGPVADTLAASEAVHRVHVADLIDAQGQDITAQVVPGELILEAMDFASGYGLTSYSSGVHRDAMFRLSDLPPRYELRASVAVPDPRETDDEQRRYLLGEWRAVGQGLDAHWPLGLDARTAGKAEFEYADADWLQHGDIGVQIKSWLFRIIPGSGLLGHGTSSYSLVAPAARPIRATVFAPAAALTPEVTYAEFIVSQLQDAGSINAWWKAHALTGVLGFPGDGRHVRIGSIDWRTRVVTTRSGAPASALSIDDGPTFFSSHFGRYDGWLVARNDQIDEYWDASVQLQDALHNEFPRELPYRVSCAASPEVGSGTIGGSPYAGVLPRFLSKFIEIPPSCTAAPLDLQLTMSVDVLDAGATSQLELHLVPDPSTPAPAPHLAELALLDDGGPSRLLDGTDPRVRLRWRAARPGQPAPQVAAEYRLDQQTQWQALTLVADGDHHEAALPTFETQHVVSLRLTARGSDGSSERQTLNSLFLLGAGALFSDGFEGDR